MHFLTTPTTNRCFASDLDQRHGGRRPPAPLPARGRGKPRVASENEILIFTSPRWGEVASASERVRGFAILILNSVTSIPLHAAGIGPIDDAAVASRQTRNLLHLSGAEGEIEDRGVFRKPPFLAGARDHDDVLLHQITQTDLRRGLAMRGTDARQKLVVARAAARDRAIGDDRHVMFATGGDHFGLVEKRMAFDLIAHQGLARE